jgi:methylmalonyl-CoA mutase
VNTFIDPKTMAVGYVPPKIELARASQDEKNYQLDQVRGFQKTHHSEADVVLKTLKESVLHGGNIFEALMIAARVCSLYQMTTALYEVGGQYRRNL